MVDEAVDGGERHGRIGEDLAPLAERLIGRNEDRASFVTRTDELEQHTGLGLVLADVGQVVEDQEVEAIEPVDGGLEGELATRDLKLLNEIGGAGEEDAPSILDQGEADGGGEMAFAAAGRTSVTMPGVWDLRCRSSTRSIPDVDTWWAVSAASNTVARSTSSSGSQTAH